MDMDSCSLSPVVAGTDSPRLVRPALHIPLRNLATTNNNVNMTNAMLSPTNSEYGTIGSPMSNLALNLSGLSTEGFGDTPRRKLSLSSTESTPIMTNTTPDSAGSVESGCFVDSPGSMIDSPTIEMTLQKRFPGISLKLDDGSGRKQRSLPFRRMNSLPMPQFRLSPVDFHEKNSSSAPMETSHSAESDLSSSRTTFPDDEGSQDSGVGFEKDLSSDGFCFAAPVGMPPRRGGHLKVISEDTCSPQKYSPSKERTSPRKFRSVSLSALSGLDSLQTRTGGNSPLKTSPLTSLDDDSDNDDGFLEVLDKEVEEISGGTLPNSFGSLFQAPVIQKETPSKSEDFLIRRNPKCKLLARSQSFDVRSRVCNKRQSPGREDDSTPVQKRRRGSCVAISTQITPPPKALLKRCHSETEAMIKSALDRVAEDPDLIGDCSKPYCLPTVPGKHQDLKSITPETLSKVLNHEYDHIIDKFVIVDCRYPYEFEGGHIQGAQNYYTKESILTNLIENQVQPDNSLKRVVIIFHCEFSSERGPNLSRFLRNKDRGCNKDVYPQLYYPEIYLLHGGYKNFFETEKQCCVPQTYMPMHHQDYKEEMRRFRMKSKSWAGEKKSSRSALFKGF